MKIQDVMSTQVESIPPTTTLRRAAQKMDRLNIGALPVVSEQGELLGIITDRDISCFAIAMGHEPNSTQVQKIMTQQVFTCSSDQELDTAARLMKEKHVRRLAVLDKDDKLAGFLSVDDLAHCSHELAGAVLESATPVH